MPTYDYLCDACGHKFEQFQSITAKPLVKCPECGKRKLQRLIGIGGGVIFKGSGFHQTDYRSDSYKQGAKAATAKTDSKPCEGCKAQKECPAAKASDSSSTKPAAAAAS
ncbi:MAG: zinc ribbon domain-containing protein [Phycisphaerae bacterium]|nr:zinc ribbon domain-containing protein [Phycisphaerae bacterium]